MNVPARRNPPAAAPHTTALAKIENMPQWLAEPLQRFAGNQSFELILPAIPVNSQPGWGYVPSVSVVTLNPDTDGPDVYKVGWKDNAPTLAYTKVALEKLASAAGISLRTMRVDDKSDRDYCEVEAVGTMKNESGVPIEVTARKAFHMKDVEADSWNSRVKANERAKSYKKSEEELRAAHESEMLSFRRHLVARTESGAVNRVIRKLLAVPSGLSAAQVAKPKVLIRFDFRPDPGNDIEMKKLMLQQGYGSTNRLFGPAAPTHQTRHTDAEVIEDDPETERARALADNPEGEGRGVSPEAVAVGQPSGPINPEDRFYEAAEAVGLSIGECRRLIEKHQGDHDAAYQALSRMANEGKDKDTLF